MLPLRLSESVVSVVAIESKSFALSKEEQVDINPVPNNTIWL